MSSNEQIISVKLHVRVVDDAALKEAGVLAMHSFDDPEAHLTGPKLETLDEQRTAYLLAALALEGRTLQAPPGTELVRRWFASESP